MREDKIGPQTCASLGLGPVGQCGDRSQDTQKVATSIRSLQPKKDTTVQSLDFTVNRFFMKLFRKSNIEIVHYCQTVLG